ncbi:MAG: hypothetical protein ACRDP8_05820, partial [Actinopolymorphaceae bacterium]
YSPGRTLDLSVRGYAAGPATFTVSGFGKDPHVTVDGESVPVDLTAGNASVTIDLSDTAAHEVRVTR